MMKFSVNPFIRKLLLLACLASAAMPFIPVYGAEAVRIGVLAFRSKSQTLAQWQPLAAALKQAMPQRDFVVEALTLTELEHAVSSRQLDYVLTNPGHYVLMAKRNGLSATLATLRIDEGGYSSSVFGGVIVSRAEQADINTLHDLRNKTIAVVNTTSLGGYQMQQYELSKVGIRLAQETKLIITGLPQDNVIQAVLAGRADAGFVRTGVLEAMAREGKLDMKQIKVINRQNLPDFPVQVSTRTKGRTLACEVFCIPIMEQLMNMEIVCLRYLQNFSERKSIS